MLCLLCESVQQNVRNNDRYNWLEQVGMTERVGGENRTKTIWITHYVCQFCGANWRHEDNPVNACAGWSLELQPEPSSTYSKSSILLRNSAYLKWQKMERRRTPR